MAAWTGPSTSVKKIDKNIKFTTAPNGNLSDRSRPTAICSSSSIYHPLTHTGLPNGDLDFFNQSWLEFMGVQSEDLLGCRRTDAIHPEDVATIVRKWRPSLAGGSFYGKTHPKRIQSFNFVAHSASGARPRAHEGMMAFKHGNKSRNYVF